MQWGNYNGLPSHTITLLEGMQRYLPTSNLIYEPVCGHTDSTLFILCSHLVMDLVILHSNMES